MAGNKSENLTTLAVSSSSNELAQQLRKLTASLTPQDQEATLSTLRRIFDNIIQYPNDDKYRQIKLTGKVFSSKVWQYPAGEELMKMSGWVVEGDHVRLRYDSCVPVLYKLLEEKLKEINSCSSECCTLSGDVAGVIVAVICAGNGKQLKDILKQYNTSRTKFIQIKYQDTCTPIIAIAFKARQIGIARILVNEYGVDPNVLEEDGDLYFLRLFDGCDSTEPCQSLIIQFIKEFKMDVHKRNLNIAALHHAVLHKLFSVVKFLVEDCKVDINCTSNLLIGGTPLHMAYGIGEKNIAQYLIEHGANQEAIDDYGRKPKDYEIYENNLYYATSKSFKKADVLLKTFCPESHHYVQLCKQGMSEDEAMDRTFEKFPSLQKCVDGGYVSWKTLCDDGGVVNQKMLETPTLKELNGYITDMAPSYYGIGLQLDIVNSQLKLIKNDPSLSDLKEKCRKMLEVWLEKDTSATWKKLCDALEEEGLNVLADQIKTTLR